MAGARDVMKVAPLAALLGVLFGVIVGMVMGYFGGWIDLVLGRIVEAFLALPVILLALLAATTLGSSTTVVIGVVAALFTPVVARTVRSAVVAERDLEYVHVRPSAWRIVRVVMLRRSSRCQRPDIRRAHRAVGLRRG
jgi:peptide/nickel transport system permease protein